jgi:hypothetical protein
MSASAISTSLDVGGSATDQAQVIVLMLILRGQRCNWPCADHGCFRNRRFRLMTMRFVTDWRHTISAVDDVIETALRAEVLRLGRRQVALAVDGFIEHALATLHGLRPIRIFTLVSIRGDLGTTRQLTEVGTGDFGVGMIERIDREVHGFISFVVKVNDAECV